MLTEADIIQIPYTPDLTESGIAFAKRWLVEGHASSASSITMQMRKQVSNAAVELAFRRYLNTNKIPFDIKNALPFSDPGQFNVHLGGHRCILQNNLVKSRKLISGLRNEPGKIMSEPVFISEEELPSADRYGKEILIFSALLGLTANSRDDLQKVQKAGQPVCMIHPVSIPKVKLTEQASPGFVLLKSESKLPVQVEIGGLDSSGQFSSERITLPTLKSIFSNNSFSVIKYIQCENIPSARIAMKHTNTRGVYIIQPEEWHNIYIYGMEIWLPGYLPQDEFRRRSIAGYTPSLLYQTGPLKQKQLSLPAGSLLPLQKLFEQVKKWKQS